MDSDDASRLHLQSEQLKGKLLPLLLANLYQITCKVLFHTRRNPPKAESELQIIFLMRVGGTSLSAMYACNNAHHINIHGLPT